MVTRADECLQNAKDLLKEVCSNLEEFLDEDTWGNDDYNVDFQKDVLEYKTSIYKILLSLR